MRVNGGGARFKRALAVLSTLFVGAAFGATVSLPANVKIGAAEDLVVPVTVTPADGITQLSLRFSYDPAVLALQGAYRTSFAHDFTINSSSSLGTIDLAMSDAGPALTGSGEVVWLLFHVTAGEGSSSALHWLDSKLNGGAIPSSNVDGSVAVVAAQAVISTPDDAHADAAASVKVPINADPATGGDAFDLVMKFDRFLLQATNVEKTPLTASMTLTFNINNPGEVRISLFSTAAISGSGPLVNVTFSVLGSRGTQTPLNVTRGDINEKAISSNLDDGLFLICSSMDPDGDGFSGCGGDCDDTNSAVHPGASEICNGIDDNCNALIDDGISPPSGRPALSVSKSGATSTIGWSPISGAQGYDSVRGDLTTLLGSGGDFTPATQSCLADNSPATSVSDSDLPSAGNGSWYLTRAENCGGNGSYDGPGSRQSGLRDAEIQASAAACP